jgi:hypothetical protein
MKWSYQYMLWKSANFILISIFDIKICYRILRSIGKIFWWNSVIEATNSHLFYDPVFELLSFSHNIFLLTLCCCYIYQHLSNFHPRSTVSSWFSFSPVVLALFVFEQLFIMWEEFKIDNPRESIGQIRWSQERFKKRPLMN